MKRHYDNSQGEIGLLALWGRSDRTLALAVGLLSLLIHLPLLDLPFERDEGGYAYIAWRLGHGEVPYRDWFELKPPGVFWAYRLALALPVDPIVAAHGLAAVVAAATAAACFLLARRILDRGAALAAGVLYAWIAADPTAQGFTANTEIFMMLPVLLASLVFLDAVHGRRAEAPAGVLVGLLLGVAVAFKQVAAVYVPGFLLLHPLLSRGEGRGRRLAVFALSGVAGGLLVWMPTLAWFHAHGALPALIDAVLLHNLAYAAQLGPGTRLSNLGGTLRSLVGSQGIVWILAGVGFVSLARGAARGRAVFMGGWALVSALGVSASGWFFPHYFQQLLPAVSICAGAACRTIHDAAVWAAVPARLRKLALGAAALGATVSVTLNTWRLPPDEAIRRLYAYDAFDAMPVLARELAAASGTDDEVFLFGADPEVLFYARRRSASRYIYLAHVYGPYGDLRERQEAVKRELNRDPPAAIVYIPHSFMTGESGQDLTRWVRKFAKKHYRIRALATYDREGHRRIYTSAGFKPVLPPDERPFAVLFVARWPNRGGG